MKDNLNVTASKEFWYEVINLLNEQGDRVHQNMATIIMLDLNKQMHSKVLEQ